MKECKLAIFGSKESQKVVFHITQFLIFSDFVNNSMYKEYAFHMEFR